MTEFNGFCDTPLWVENLTWNTTIPVFTPCFLDTILVWLPCSILWLLAPLEFWKIKSTCSLPNPWTFLNMAKILINVFLVLLNIVDVVEVTQNTISGSPLIGAEISAPFIETASFLLVIALSLYSRKKGVGASLLLPAFWLFETISTVLQLYSTIIQHNYENVKLDDVLVTSQSGKCLLVLVQLILSSFSELPAEDAESGKTCPAKNSSLFSYLTFFWIRSIVIKGYRNQLAKDNLLPLCPDISSETVSKTFDKAFKKGEILPVRELEADEVETEEETANLITKHDIHPPISVIHRKRLLWALFRTSAKPLCAGIILDIIHSLCVYLQPYFLNLLIEFIQSGRLQWHGIVYAVCFYLSGTVAGFLDFHHDYFLEVASAQIKSTLTSAIYRKVFLISSDARKKYTPGDIINLMSVDTYELFEFTAYSSLMWSIPLRIVIGIYFVWQYLGISCLASFVIMLILAPTTVILARISDKVQERQMEEKDERVRIMNEILNGIKVLKLYAWERPFMKRVTDVRSKELSYLRKFDYLESGFQLLWTLAPSVVSVACFATYVLIDKDHILNTQTVFVSLSLFNLLRFPMGALPDLLSRLIKARVSLRRIETFLNCEELDQNSTGNQANEGDAVNFRKASFSWEFGKEPVLKDINVNIEKGLLVAIVGPVGSGKSSLLSALLGEMNKVGGSVDIAGSLAYVPQVPWIQNATLRDNIIFTREWNKNDYDIVLESCALIPDLEILPGRDMTEIGEKGINLSGGQKQRVSLARAVYQMSDVYLLDDPLSAVDANVAKHLFNEVIGPNGLLWNKTRLLATHNVAFLSEMDHIIIMDNGKITDQGTYECLIERNKDFSDFLHQHAQQQDTTTEKKDDVLDKPDELSVEKKRIVKQSSLIDGHLTDEEHMAIGKVKWSVYYKYLKSIGILLSFGILTAMIAIVSFEVVGGVWLSQWSTDKPLPDGQQDISQRNKRLIVYSLLICGEGLFILLGNVLLVIGATKAAARFHWDLLNRIMRAPLSFFDITPTGRIINRFSNDVESVDSSIPQTFHFFCTMLFWYLSTIVVMGLASYILVFCFIPMIAIYYLLLKVYVTTSRQLSRLESVSRSPIYDNFSETISGTSSIRAYQSVAYFVQRSYDRVDHNSNCYFLGMAVTQWLQVTLVLVGGFIVLVTALLAVFARDVLDEGLIALALTYSVDVTDDLSWIVRLAANLETNMVSLERIREFCQIEQEADWDKSDVTLPTNWPEEATIKLNDYSTTYREGLAPVLNNINLDIKEGEKVGIVGRTGAGKSSLLLSLFRIIEPTGGRILIDDLDITQIGLHTLRSKLTVIPQDPVIFGGSLRMNLDPWDEHTDDEMWTALEHSHLKTFVSSLPGGLEYVLTEGGTNISAGQRQLVCLTRALLRQTRILLLDEATASVDLETDQLVHDTIREAFSHCTIIVIAHRLHTVMECDRIVVFSNGCIVEDGPPKRLIWDTSSYFYNMARDAGLV